MDKRINHKKSIQIFSNVLLSLSLYTWGDIANAMEHWYLPSHMKEQPVAEVQIENISNEPLDFWLNPPFVAGEEPLEYTQSIPAHSTVTVTMDQLKDLPVSKFYHLKSYGKDLKVKILWPNSTNSSIGTIAQDLVRSVRNPSIAKLEKKSEMEIPRQSIGSKYLINATNVIYMYNLSPFEQTVQVITQSKWTHPIQTFKIPGFGAIEVELNVADFYEVNSQQRVMILDPNINRIITPQPANVLYKQPSTQNLHLVHHQSSHQENPNPVFFELSNQERSISYVVKFTDAIMIEQARYQIKNPNKIMPRVLTARIQPTHGGFNQDLRDPYLAPWSWHVTEPSGFAEIVGDFCDVSPDIVEFLLDAWLANTKPICFSKFRIVKELK